VKILPSVDHIKNKMRKYTQSESRRLGIDFNSAANIIHLRLQNNWSQEKEDYLLSIARQGKNISSCDNSE